MVLSLFLVAAFTTAVVAVVVAVKRLPPPVEAGEPITAEVTGAGAPIASEAGVFRTRLAMLAIGDPATPRRNANPRTLHTFRVRRAYPGAPPIVPHGLTLLEARTNACNNCHARGGYSPRFGAYVPVTPHPEMGSCLQCHAADDATVGVTLPTYDPNTICRQCHDPDALRPARMPMGWQVAPWPRPVARTGNGPPPTIPHDLHLRSNCVACHAGPGAVAELRTDHPARSNCRQCHVLADEPVEPFVRRRSASSAGEGGGS